MSCKHVIESPYGMAVSGSALATVEAGCPWCAVEALQSRLGAVLGIVDLSLQDGGRVNARIALETIKAELARYDSGEPIKQWVLDECALRAELELTVESLEKANVACDSSANRLMEVVAERDSYASRLDSLRAEALDWIHGEDCDGYADMDEPGVEALECTCGVGDVLRTTIPGCKVFVEREGDKTGLSRVVERGVSKCTCIVGPNGQHAENCPWFE